MAKTLRVYPTSETDTFVKSYDIPEGKDLTDVLLQIRTDFKLGEGELSNTGFTFYTENNKPKAVPFEMLKIAMYTNKKEVSVRICSYPMYFGPGETGDPWENDSYFAGYANMYIHWEMLSDVRRCSAYKQAVVENIEDFKDKIILDVGCGTGILSIFCAHAGAKKVYAVDASDIIYQADAVIKANKLQDKIQLIHGKIEEIELPVPKVDIIISEWMGYFCIFESMLQSVIFAKNKWLAEDGFLFPGHAKMFISPLDYTKFWEERVEFFEKKVEGVIITPLLPLVKEEFTNRCLRATEIAPEELIDEGFVFKEIDLYNTNADEIQTTHTEFSFNINPKYEKFHGYGTWFEVYFQGSDKSKKPVVLSTNPKYGKTHWKQECFLFKDPISLKKDNVVKGTIDVTQMPDWKRHYNIKINTVVGNQNLSREWAI
eukprot:TRINITY_DN5218_c0_g1_i1.p1 TRINITY_DN5218_c0_g1~~TRINITY_DN5218_c0_g1_i1.p1  ORF type:complete len:429 (+),score=61.32 TRINITY_DN5218_c0_g1_i1:50-1336(+)